jgi:predicted DNA binding CopG/RHH family protein
MSAKDKMFAIRVPEKLLEEFKQFCDENSMNVSKRLRKFMEQDIEVWKRKKLQRNNGNPNP